MRSVAAIATFLLVSILENACGEEVEAAVLASGNGVLQKQAIVRREDGSVKKELQQDHAHHHKQHHSHSVQHAKALFKAMDSNGDGILSESEVTAAVGRSDVHIPKVLQEAWSNIDNSRTLSYDEFMSGVHAAFEAHTLHHSLAELTVEEQKVHRAAVHEHNLLELQSKAANDGWVSCGGHQAPNCADCPYYKNGARGTVNHGFEWCNGDCVFKDNVCHQQDGSITASTGMTSNGHATPAPQQADVLPDIQNRSITDYDNTVIDNAARDAVKEEVKEQDMKAEKEEEEKKFDSRKFWFVMVIIFSVFVGICLIATIVAVLVFCCMSHPDDEAGKDIGDEADALAEADGEDDAVAAGES